MVKAALFGDVDDFGVVVAQEGNCPQQAHFHSQSGDGKAEVLMEQPIEMSPAATKTVCELMHGKGQHVIRREAFEDLYEVIFDAHVTGSLGLEVLEFCVQDSSGQAKQVPAVIEVELRRNVRYQLVALRS